jgi:hypothetical protein
MGKAKIILIKTEAVAVFYSHFTKTNAIQPVLQSFSRLLVPFKHNCSSMALMAGRKKTVFPSIFAEIKFVFKGNHNSHPHPQ